LRGRIGRAKSFCRRLVEFTRASADDLRPDVGLRERVHSLCTQPLVAFWARMINVRTHVGATAGRDEHEAETYCGASRHVGPSSRDVVFAETCIEAHTEKGKGL
jgi:hypothetical protein